MAKRRKKRDFTPPKKSKSSNALLYIVIGAMLFSGLYYLGRSDDRVVEDSTPPLISTYEVQQIGNSSIFSEVKALRPEIVAKLDFAISYVSIRHVLNSSAPGLREVSMEIGNPQLYQDGVDGDYLLFKFAFDNLTDNETAAVEDLLQDNFGGSGYAIYRACTGELPLAIGGSAEVYMLCRLDAQAGEKFRVFLFEKTLDGFPEGVIGFASTKLVAGPVVEAEVVNLTSLVAEAKLLSDFDPVKLKDIEQENIQIVSPAYVLESVLPNETLEELKSLPGVEAGVWGNQTHVSFNSSSEEIEPILGSAGYVLEEGYVGLTVPVESDQELLEERLLEAGASNVSFGRIGTVSTYPEVLIDNKLVYVSEDGRLSATLKEGSGVGDTVEIYLMTLDFGGQVYVMDAREV